MGVFKNVPVLIVVAAVANFSVADVLAQTPSNPPPTSQSPPPSGGKGPMLGAEQRVEGQVKSVNASGTEITLTDGTTLVTPAGAAIRPGILTEGSMVVASYREENGNKVLTDLALKEPAASPPTTPRTPGEPGTAPPRPSTPRY